jgi:hypothetical protein
MRPQIDPALSSLIKSEARILTLGVLANASQPMTGYRVAAVAGLPRIKVYPELREAAKCGWIEQSASGYQMSAGPLRSLLASKVKVTWSEDWMAGEPKRRRRIQAADRRDISWFDPTKYTPNPLVASRYAREFTRPPEKNLISAGRNPSRKTL